ncbi:sigma-54 dependent transcriptional regulator [Undibacterium sp.]|uniref:sigma-54-dependent transcriptional regulator n=1 Tax=Undibacterium sp. TaxID=1914977 RepID=UPI0025D2E98B|nr:sigma-54 dependent transcriptional regulator [Undibacterium sp.]
MLSQAHLLIVEDDVDVACAAQLLLRRRFASVRVAHDMQQLDRELQQPQVDLVLLDFNFSPGRIDGAEGLQVLQRLLNLPHAPVVIAMTAYADVPLAVQALKLGAQDFITKPWDNDRLVSALNQAYTAYSARSQRTKVFATASHADQLSQTALDAILGDSASIQTLKRMILSVAPTQANVMILGENGVGKELVAKAVHQASLRQAGPMLAVDMGALPEATFESELFGHRKGSFTDARSDRLGRFQAARGGSLFLDEIGNMPLAAQAKLLTALERREVTPLGSDRSEAIDVRVISATNLEEAQLFNPAIFRSDLLFRLNTIVLRVPALRERKQDIPILMQHYLRHYQSQYNKPVKTCATACIHALQDYSWPGNVRSLRHACERAVILSQSDEYQLSDFSLHEMAPTVSMQLTMPATNKNQVEINFRLDLQERDTVQAALDKAQGNVSQAAKLLGVSRAALYRKMERYGI